MGIRSLDLPEPEFQLTNAKVMEALCILGRVFQWQYDLGALREWDFEASVLNRSSPVLDRKVVARGSIVQPPVPGLPR